MKYLLGVNFSNLGKIQYFLTEEISNNVFSGY